MRLASVVLAAFLCSVGSPAIACESRPECVTEITVVDCDGDAVPGATVTARCRSGGQSTAVTNSYGTATLKICPTDIKSVGVTAEVTASASGSCSSSPCTIRYCHDPVAGPAGS